MKELITFVNQKNEELEELFYDENDTYGFVNQIRLTLIISQNVESIEFLGFQIWNSHDYPTDFRPITKNIEKILKIFAQ